MTKQAPPETARHSLIKWAAALAALLVVGPLVGALVGSLRGPSGQADATILWTDAPISGLVALAAVAIGALILGGLVARIGDRTLGMTGAGYVIAWGAYRSANMETLWLSSGSTGSIFALAAEGLLAAVVGVALITTLNILDRAPSPPGETNESTAAQSLKDRALAGLLDLKNRHALAALGAAILASLVAAWVVAFNGTSGQGVFAGLIGGVAAGAAARLASDALGGRDAPSGPARASEHAGLGVLIAGVIAPLILLAVPGGGGLEEAARDGTLPGIAFVQPLSWLAGALLGAPLGTNWAGSLIEEHAPSKSANKPAKGRHPNKKRPAGRPA